VSPSLSLHWSGAPRHLSSFPTRRSSDLAKFAQLLSVLSTILGDNGLFRLLLFQQLLLHLPIAFKLCNLQLNLFFRCLNLSSFYLPRVVELLEVFNPLKSLIEVLRCKNEHQFIVSVFITESKQDHFLVILPHLLQLSLQLVDNLRVVLYVIVDDPQFRVYGVNLILPKI